MLTWRWLLSALSLAFLLVSVIEDPGASSMIGIAAAVFFMVIFAFFLDIDPRTWRTSWKR